ncbi:MAG: Gldg family protein [Spirochaetota bacterium]
MEKRKQELLIFVLAVGILFFIILNSTLFYFRVDLTENKVFTISNVSKGLFYEIPEKVRITYYLSEKIAKLSPYPGQVKDLLYEYAAYSRGKIEVSIVDPAKGNLTTQAESLGVMPQRIEVMEKDEQTFAIIYSGIVIEYLDRYKTLPFVLRTETLEYDLTSNIRKVVQNKERHIGVLLGDRTRTLEADYSLLSEQLKAQYTVREIKIGEGIPDDISALLILGNKDIEEKDLKPIDSFIMRGGPILFCVEGVYVDLGKNLSPVSLAGSALLKYLNHFGVNVRSELVLDRYSKNFRIPQQLFGGIAWQILGSYPEWVAIVEQNVSKQNPITSRFSRLDLLWASPLEIRNISGLTSEKLFSSSKESWLMPPPFNTNPYDVKSFYRSKEESSGQYLLGAVLYGKFQSYFPGEDEKSKSALESESRETRMLVLGDTDFLSNIIQYSDSAYNMFFLSNCLEWLSSDDDLLLIKTRAVRDVRLNKIEDPEAKKSAYLFAQIINLVVIPLLVVFFGLNRWFSRRKKQIS